MKLILSYIARGFKSLFSHSGVKTAVVASLLLSTGMAARAQLGVYTYSITIGGAPAGANGMELVFTGTGGTVTNIVGIGPSGQVITPNGPAGANNGWTATFPAVTAGSEYLADFTASFPNVSLVNSGVWTVNGQDTTLGVPVTITLIAGTPLPAWVTIALAGIVLAAGLYFINGKKLHPIV